jgi:hypothetical protein
MMSTFPPVPVLATLGFVAASVITVEAWGEEFQCQRGEQVRRVEVQFADDADRLPCEVVYWRDTEAPGQSETLWNAQNQLDYCRDKAREMVERLESGGWACDAMSTDAAAAAASPERRPPDAVGPNNPASAEEDEPARSNARADRATLRAALTRDLRRLEELTTGSSGGFATDTATLGDLNGDGMEDAAVLLTHRVEGAEPSHYLLAYLFDGETFQPVARINLEAFYQNVSEVGIEGVTDGAVEILLRFPRADDPACCPSGRRQATFGLQDRAFVLLRESEPGA